MVTVAVYCVPAARLTEGTNIAVVLLAITVPATAAPPVRLKVKLEVFSEELLIASENVTDIDEFINTPVSVFDGNVSDTVGGVVSEVSIAGNDDVASSTTPLPHPERLRPANRAAESMAAAIPDPTALSFDICEALRIEHKTITQVTCHKSEGLENSALRAGWCEGSRQRATRSTPAEYGALIN